MGSRLLRPDNRVAWMRSDAPELEDKLQNGDGMGFPGDPRLTLAQGVIQANRRMQHPITKRWVRKGEILARRWEVWRLCEDGVDRRIGTWRMEEFDRILLDMSGMRLDSPGHADTIDQIEKHNAEIEDRVSRDAQDALGQMLDHGNRLVSTLRDGANTFLQMPGLRDTLKKDGGRSEPTSAEGASSHDVVASSSDAVTTSEG